MLKSMTGFGGREKDMPPFGKISVELRSTNHKFLEAVMHLPQGFLSLEDKIKSEIEAKIRRGRVTCAINITGGENSDVFVNSALLAKYLEAMERIRGKFRLKEEVSLDTLIHLPGVLSLAESVVPKAKIWPKLKVLLDQSIEDLVRTRQKEGAALSVYLIKRTQTLKNDISAVKAHFSKTIKKKLATLQTDEERSSFLKNSDITEELERLDFHCRNLIHKLSASGPIGKELDFIAQEMQREANTMGAKSCDSFISARGVEIKSKIEKIREQVQNIE
ncbi:MAG: YicC family protein [Candidatus Omnitrophica bacterium]|nr:YicC family protein [Candidatus Omnitrophota bacterium]